MTLYWSFIFIFLGLGVWLYGTFIFWSGPWKKLATVKRRALSVWSWGKAYLARVECGRVAKVLSVTSSESFNTSPWPESSPIFWGLKQGLFNVLLWSGILWLWFGNLRSVHAVYALLIAGIVWGLPDLYVKWYSQRYQQSLSDDVAYFFEVLGIVLQGGDSLENSLITTAKQLEGPLANAVGKELKELAWGRRLEEVFQRLKSQIEDPDFHQFLNSVHRAKQLGVSLHQALQVQIELLQTRRRQRAEELSRTAAVKMSLPLVLFIFPSLLIIYIGPGVLQLLQRV